MHGPVGIPWICGPAGSITVFERMLTVWLTVVLLPALSVQVPVATWPAPLLLNVTGGVQEAMPDSVSAPVNVTVTGVVFQPLASGAGVTVAVTAGAVLIEHDGQSFRGFRISRIIGAEVSEGGGSLGADCDRGGTRGNRAAASLCSGERVEWCNHAASALKPICPAFSTLQPTSTDCFSFQKFGPTRGSVRCPAVPLKLDQFR